jgi:hypothetical protein
MTSHKTIILRKETYDLIRDNVEREYRRHHPELDHIPLSIEKLEYEMIKYYCLNTPFDIRK